MKKFQKLLSAGISLTAMLCGAAGISLPAQAADAPNIVVIGDGVSSGAKLADGENSYVDWIAYYTDAQIQNFAQDDYMTGDVLASLNDVQVQKALSEADIILVTAGINDIMAPFFEVANSYLEEFGFSQFSDVFSAKLQDYGFTSEDELTPYANKLASAARSNKKTAAANLEAITAALSQYENAKVIYQTVYNAADTIENIDSLSEKRKSAYESICNPITSVVNSAYNKHLHSIEGTGNAVVVDTFAGFAGLAYRYTNLNDLDMNPTAEGHIWIADAVMSAAGLEKKETETTTTTTTTTSTTTTPATTASTTTTTTSTVPATTTSTTTTTTTTETTTTVPPKKIIPGDLNQDGITDAADAAEILKAAANLGAGRASGLSPELEQAANVNGDAELDAADAAVILTYAAGKGSGTITVEFEDYLKTL